MSLLDHGCSQTTVGLTMPLNPMMSLHIDSLPCPVRSGLENANPCFTTVFTGGITTECYLLDIQV